MALLNLELQQKIDKLSEEAYDKFQNHQIEESFKLLQTAWDLYPEPKNQWNEAYNNAKYLFDDYIKVNSLNEAKIWLDRMIENNNTLHLSEYEVQYREGIYYYESGDYEEALKMWQYVVKEAGFRYFENDKPQYLEFYKNPERNIK